MARFIDTKTGCELLPGIHDTTGARAFSDDHFLFQPVPDGIRIVWEGGEPTLQRITASIDEVGTSIRIERDTKLNENYSRAIQQLTRWINEAEHNPAALTHYKTQRTAWHAWADALCYLPDQPGWPWLDSDVPWPEHPPKPTRYDAP